MKSGMIAAENIYQRVAISEDAAEKEINKFQTDMENSWVFKELKDFRNSKNAFKYGLYPGLLINGLHLHLTKVSCPVRTSMHSL